jgi:3-mercaptopyruvate sulfurtransferase SseA
VRGGSALSTVISAMQAAGLTNFHNVTGGMSAWQRAGYTVTKSAKRAGRVRPLVRRRADGNDKRLERVKSLAALYLLQLGSCAAEGARA